MVESVADKVKELPCTLEELECMQQQYKEGNVFQRRGEIWIRVIGDEFPSEGQYVEEYLTLEDAYLYYLGK